MRIIRDAQITSGFLYEEPLESTSPVTHCGDAVCMVGHEVPWHAHPGFELHMLVRGHYPWRVAGQTIWQQMGQIMIFHPQQRHRTHGKAAEECHHLWIGLHLDRLNATGKHLAKRLITEQRQLLGECREIEPVLRGIIAQVVTPRPRQRQVVGRYLDLLARLLLQQLEVADNQQALCQPYDYPIQKVLYHMQTQLDHRLTVSELAAIAGWSVTHLCNQFHKQVGVTPVHYHQQLRLQAARNALKLPDASITKVALEFGFSSSQHFATLFQKAYGLAPREYMRQRT
jgi:AraC family transcriptional regulator